MPKSTAFARIKTNVLELIRRVPRGKLTTFAAIAELCDIDARQAAYLLATCADVNEDGEIPWHRAVSVAGVLQAGKRRTAQIHRLQNEGHQIGKGTITVLPMWHPLGPSPVTAAAHPNAATRRQKSRS